MGLIMAMVMLVSMGLPAALSADANISRKESGLQSYPVYRATTIYKGGMVSRNSTGYLVASTDDPAATFVGVAYEGVGNSSGSDGDLEGRVYTEGVFLLPATSITQVMVGQLMYIVDDATFDNLSTYFVCCGTLVRYVSAALGWVDIGQRSRVVAFGMDIYVEKNGDDTGPGTEDQPVKTLTAAVALVTTSRLRIHVGEGTFAEAAAVVFPTIDNVQIIGAGNHLTTISATGTRVFTVTPGVQTGTYEGTIEGMNIDHSAGSSQSGIVFDNTSITKKLIFYIKNCSFEVDAAADISINIATHADSGNAIRVYVSGDGNQVEIEGAIYFAVNNNGDRLHLENLWLVGLVTTSATAVEFRARLYRCVVPHEGAVAGGNGLQRVVSVNTYSWIDYNDLTQEIYAALDTNELTGSHGETIVD